MRDLVTSVFSHLKNIDSLGYADLPNVIHFVLSKKLPGSVSPPMSPEKPVSARRLSRSQRFCKVSIFFFLKAQILSSTANTASCFFEIDRITSLIFEKIITKPSMSA